MTAEPLSNHEVTGLRAATPGADNMVHLNHAGSSLPTRATLDRQIAHLELEAMIGGYEAAGESAEQEAAVYASIAKLLNAGSPSEIARFEHATTAWNAALWSLPMRPGQRIVTANAAYGANAIGFLRAVERHGVEIDVIPNDEHGQVDLAKLANRLDDDVALVAVTHIPTNGGLINPAAEIGALTRATDIPYLLDACQSAGQVTLDVEAIGCDFLSATGRKYLRGPRGTGFLYARQEMIDRVGVDHPDHHGATWDRPDGYTLGTDARRFEYWEFSHAGWLGLGVAVDQALEIGSARIEATIKARAESLRSRLESAGHTVYDLGADRGGIVTTNVAGHNAFDVKDHLRANGVNSSVTTPDSTLWDATDRELGDMVRLSVHYLTTEAELDAALEALGTI